MIGVNDVEIEFGGSIKLVEYFNDAIGKGETKFKFPKTASEVLIHFQENIKRSLNRTLNCVEYLQILIFAVMINYEVLIKVCYKENIVYLF